MSNTEEVIKTEESFRQEINTVIAEFIPKLFLQQFTFEIHSGCKSESALYECVYNYPYLNAKIRYSARAYKEWASEEVKDIRPFVLHELCHLLTDPLYSKACSRYTGKEDMEDERERLTDWICNIVLAK